MRTAYTAKRAGIIRETNACMIKRFAQIKGGWAIQTNQELFHGFGTRKGIQNRALRYFPGTPKNESDPNRPLKEVRSMPVEAIYPKKIPPVL